MKNIVSIIITIIIIFCGCTAQDIALPESSSSVNEIPQSTSEPSPTPNPTFTPMTVPTATPEPKLLEGYKIGIDPGHQFRQNDNMEQMSPYYSKEKIKVSLGAKGIKSGVREYIFNLEISLMLKDALEAQGAQVYMTRMSNDVNISNKERAQLVKENDCDIWIRVHANYSSDREKIGIVTLTPKKRSVSTYIFEQSEILSGLIQKNVIDTIGANDFGLAYRGDITGFNWSRIPVTLIECGYLSNADEDLLLQTYEYKLLLVGGIVQGMIDYFAGSPIPIEYGDN